MSSRAASQKLGPTRRVLALERRRKRNPWAAPSRSETPIPYLPSHRVSHSLGLEEVKDEFAETWRAWLTEERRAKVERRGQRMLEWLTLCAMLPYHSNVRGSSRDRAVEG
jgi:hypothetical protein